MFINQADVIVIGAGAAGYMAAISAADHGARVVLIEKTSRTLAKLRISGGGRCNVTNVTHEPAELIKNYPRGGKELRGPFTRFGQQETVSWFKKRGVDLKAEPDGRIFPVTDSSETVAVCLERSAGRAGVKLVLSSQVTSIYSHEEVWQLETNKGIYQAKTVILAMGGQNKKSQFDWLDHLELDIVDPVPSLFTFNLPDAVELRNLMGLSCPLATVSLPAYKREYTGPILITHWGLSGPAVLKLSAFEARSLAHINYQTDVLVNWTATKPTQVFEKLASHRKQDKLKQLGTFSPFTSIASRLWIYLLERAGMDTTQRWADLSNDHLSAMTSVLTADLYQMKGKTTFVDEFVSAGGISLKEVDFRTLMFKKHPGLFACGELLDIDGITGGFNFQAAWTTGYIAGRSAAEYARELLASKPKS